MPSLCPGGEPPPGPELVSEEGDSRDSAHRMEAPWLLSRLELQSPWVRRAEVRASEQGRAPDTSGHAAHLPGTDSGSPS